jgi:hypothetical protein
MMVFLYDTLKHRRPWMAALDSALDVLRDDSCDLLLPDRINQQARELGHVFRDTPLNPGNTLVLFVRQIAHGNIACAAMTHLAGTDFTDVAWCAARQRLPVELIRQCNQQVADQIRHATDADSTSSTWRGHRLRIIDGSSDTMPDTPPLRAHYGVPGACKEGLGFPTSHLLLLMDHHSGAVLDCHDAPGKSSDASMAYLAHDQLQAGDIVLGDDSFSSYLNLALLLQREIHTIVPVHHQRIVDFTAGRGYIPPGKNTKKQSAGKPRSRQVRRLGRDDQLVEYFKPKKRPQWMSPEQWESIPASITVREIRRTISRHGFRPITFTIVTTLLDPQAYPADELIELRLTRWLIETNLRHLKITLGMDKLKCKTVEGVCKERLIFILVYNCLRLVMLQTARRAGVNPNRISFANALAWLRHGDLTEVPVLKINPLREGRLEPRVIKSQKKQFPYMTRPRKELQMELLAKHSVAA